MATVHIPPLLRDATGGADTVEVADGTLRQVIAALDRAHPGLAARLQAGDSLSPGIAAAIDGVLTRQGLTARVGPASEVHFLPAIGGG